MEYIITDGNNKDFIQLCGMLDDYLNEIVGGEKQREQYNQYNTLENIHDVILLYENGQPIACASFKEYEPGVAEVKRVFLRKEYRGKGISKELMGRLEERAKQRGYKKLILETGRPLKEAYSLYQKLGFGIIDNYGQYRCMCGSICMSKEL
jgi:GNAT superfamily N-acetyltransferase